MQIKPETRYSVVFLQRKSSSGELRSIGTAFFIRYQHNGIPRTCLVTAKHVVDFIRRSKDSEYAVYIRYNAAPEGVFTVRTDPDDWKDHIDPNVDVSLLVWEPALGSAHYTTVPIDRLVTARLAQEEFIVTGDEVFMIGLFTSHTGQNRNIPIARVGNISAMPEEPIRTARLANMDAYLIEARSLGGLSGSPVFVQLGHYRANKSWKFHWFGGAFRLLGLIHGHWDLAAADQNVMEDSDETNRHINKGIAIVTPAPKIIELIDTFGRQ